MGVFIFDDVPHAGGIWKLTIINDDPTVGTVNVHGNYLLSFGKKHERVEESGFGGTLFVDNLTVEMQDKDNIFQSQIFNKAQVTNAQAKGLLNVSGTDYEYLFGEIDFDTIKFPSDYDDEAGHEAHPAKFTAFSNLRRLETNTPTDLYNLLIFTELGASFEMNGGNAYINMMTLLDKIMGFLDVPLLATAHEVLQQWSDGVTDRNFDELYLKFSDGSPLAPSAVGYLWLPEVTDSFMTIPTLKDLLLMLCTTFVSYPLVAYDPTSDKFQLTLKQREGGNVLTPDQLGELKKSEPQQFYGYEAIKTTMISDEAVMARPFNFRTSYPIGISDSAFAKQKNTFLFGNYLSMADEDVQPTAGTALYMKDAGGTMVKATKLKDGSDTYPITGLGTILSEFQLAKFLGYWRNRSMYVRTYRGTGIGGTYPVRLLDRLDINGTRYAIIDAERDVKNNESTLKAVEFPLTPSLSPVLLDLPLWYKGDAITGVAIGDDVNTWINSGSLVGADAIVKPSGSGGILRTGQNGLPVVEFGIVRTNSFLQMTGDITNALGGNYSVFVVYKFASSELDDAPGNLSGPNKEYFLMSSLTRFAWGIFRDNVDIQNGNGTNWKPGLGYGYSRDITSYHYADFLRGTNGTNDAQAHLDGTLVATISAGSEASRLSNLVVGQYVPGISFPDLRWKGPIAEIMVYDRKLSEIERLRTQTYLKNKYAF